MAQIIDFEHFSLEGLINFFKYEKKNFTVKNIKSALKKIQVFVPIKLFDKLTGLKKAELIKLTQNIVMRYEQDNFQPHRTLRDIDSLEGEMIKLREENAKLKKKLETNQKELNKRETVQSENTILKSKLYNVKSERDYYKSMFEKLKIKSSEDMIYKYIESTLLDKDNYKPGSMDGLLKQLPVEVFQTFIDKIAPKDTYKIVKRRLTKIFHTDMSGENKYDRFMQIINAAPWGYVTAF